MPISVPDSPFGHCVLNVMAHQIGVQAQVFTIMNVESYCWPDLMRGTSCQHAT